VCGDDGTVQRVRVAFGGMAATPSRAPRCEAALLQGRWDEAAVRQAIAALDQDFEPIDDMRASKSYRRLVARNLLRKFHFETTGDARISVLDEEVFA
jgi:xanthine dehydrogenase small subunit